MPRYAARQMINLKREIELLHYAAVFLTRLPLPPLQSYSDDKLSASARYFPWVGLLVGAVAAFSVLLFQHLFDQPVLAVVLSTVVTCLLTGAFHEDGFADFCDGFGGGWEREQVLAIMKDSRLGTYGAIGLFAMLSVKVLSLSALPLGMLPAVMLLGHSTSRLLAISLMLDLEYVREQGKSKPLAVGVLPRDLVFAAVPTLVLMLSLPLSAMVCSVLLLLVLRWWLMAYLRRRIGGYTGDCLGAAQQLAEVLIYLVVLGSVAIA